MWHCRFSHFNGTRLSKFHKDGLLEQFDYESYPTYEFCLIGKITKSPFSEHREWVAGLLELVHTDVCWPMTTHARGGYPYFITFTDDHSRFRYVYLMKYKSESFEKFKEFRSEVEKQTCKSIKIIIQDREGEYLSNEFLDHLKDNGILP